MIKSHKIKLYPTKSQEILLKKSCGVARYSYNWALNKWRELYEGGEKPIAYSLIKLQNSIKREEMPFFLEVSKTAPQYAIHNLEKAFKKMWKEGQGYPKYKKKNVKDSFVAVENNNNFKQKNFRIHIPRIGKIKCAENLRFEGKVNNVVIKRVANLWFAIVNVKVSNDNIPQLNENQVSVGIDLGIKTMITCSDGVVFDNPKALIKNKKKLARYQKSLSKKQKGSKNYEKQKIKIARLHYKISCMRSNAIHQATSYIVNNYDIIKIEDLDVKSMQENHYVSKYIIDTPFYEIKRQLEYKSEWMGKQIIIVDRWFPSSKLCSNCGNKKDELKLSERIYNCEAYGIEIDRDLNASKNLVNYDPTQKDWESYVCGEFNNSGSVKQKLNNCLTQKI